MDQDEEVRALVEKFISDLGAILSRKATAAFQAKLAGLLSDEVTPVAAVKTTTKAASNGKRRGRPPGSKNAAKETPRKKALTGQRQVQTCPVPGCKNPAAPVFGMVCESHKKVPKSKITLYRKQRKFAKKNNLSFKAVAENWAKYRAQAA